jgi:L-threonylcarbamoyladenylate synthase
VYGLGANALDPVAVARIYAAKGRPAWNPVIAHVASVSEAQTLTSAWPETAVRLAEAFWPGPLTLVLPRSSIVPDIATAGGDAVAIRIPSHPVALALLRAAGVPVAAPSANRFTQVSPTTAWHVVTSLGERVDLILDGGPCQVGIESTVVDLAGAVPTVLRPGMISRAQLEAVLQVPVRAAGHERSITLVAGEDPPVPAQRSPGMADRHYAPRADVWLFDTAHAGDVLAALRERAQGGGAGLVMALLLGTTLPLDAPDVIVRMPLEPAAYARELYAALHAADAADATIVIIERPPASDPWLAVLDRLSRAAR